MEFMDILNNTDTSYLKTHYPKEEVYFDEKGYCDYYTRTLFATRKNIYKKN